VVNHGNSLTTYRYRLTRRTPCRCSCKSCSH